MQRRNLIQLALAGAASGILAPSVLQASPKSNDPNAMAGGVFYTKDAQGRWSGKAGSHLPNIEIKKKGEDVSVKITTDHVMNGYKHYIVKHTLLDKNYNFLGEKMFNPEEDEAISTFSLSKYSGPIYALSNCNKHDTWLSTAEV